MSKPVITLYDIETTPNAAYVWGHYEQNVIAYQKQWELLSFACKELHSSKIECYSRRLYTERELVHKLWDKFNESDFLIAHNGDTFDYKKALAKFLEFGLKPPAPATNIDTKKIAKKYFSFQTNKLDDLCEKLEIGRKQKNEGIDLWLECMKDNKTALLKMEDYNKQDVRILERLYLKLRPWIKKQPGLSIAESRLQCANCAGFRLVKRGTRIASNSKTQTYQCTDCGAYTSRKISKA